MKKQKRRQSDLFDPRNLSGVPPMPRRVEILALLEVLLIKAIRVVTNPRTRSSEAGNDHDHS
jgi:hypothetical protein